MRLGHIVYSNCFPIHARLIERPEAGDPVLVEGVPSTLNRLLAAGEIDVAPSSSIEYALHADRYRLLPDLVIGSRGAVRSILLVADRDPRELEGELVALPTASATSVVLLKILLAVRWRVRARFRWFDQASEDPFASGAAAALFIGDVALKPPARSPAARITLDLGAEWWEETRLPFAFALWQTSAPERVLALRELHSKLVASRAWAERERAALAELHAERFEMTAPALERYWGDLVFGLDDAMLEGLDRFYQLAKEVGQLRRVPSFRWID